MAGRAPAARLTMDPRYAPRTAADVTALIHAHPLAWVASRDFHASVLPLLAETDEQGALRSLLGHCARRNPLVGALERDPNALILFQGPHGYVSPTLVSQAKWGPTWNYAVVRIEAEVSFLPHETDASLRRLSERLEPEGRWSVERMEERYDSLQQHIMAFRAHVRIVDPVFKLGQDETDQAFDEITTGHADPVLAAFMRANRGPQT